MHGAMQQFNFLISNGQDLLCVRPCRTMEVFTGLPFYGTFPPDLARDGIQDTIDSAVQTVVVQQNIEKWITGSNLLELI